MNQEEILKRLAHFQGYGDLPRARFLFIGIEESSPFKNHADLERFLERSKLSTPWYREVDAAGQPKGITERMQNRLSFRLRKSNEQSYGFCQEHEFCANIFPLGAPAESLQPGQYSQLFGMGKEKVQNHIKATRAMLIRDLITKFRDRSGLVFVFGKRATSFVHDSAMANQQLATTQEILFKETRPSKLRYYKEHRMWFCGHPSHGWFNDIAIDRICEVMNRERL